MIQEKVDIDFLNGLYVDVSDKGSPVAGYILLDNGEIKSIWNKESDIDLFHLFDRTLQMAVINGKANPTLGYFFTFMKEGDPRIESFSQRKWFHDKNGDWHRFSIQVTALLSR